MPDAHWENLKEIFHEAVALAPEKRAAYLDRACDGDVSLRQAIEALIKSHEETGFVDQPAYQAAADLLMQEGKLNAGQSVGRYRVVSLIGEGGMGRVYLAEDTKLHRKVSLKFLSTTVTQDHARLRRFEQEARAASALNHPNIITIHEIGEENGHRFIATEFIEGQTLREQLRSPLDVDEALEIAIQIASALVAAHRVNIVHRDIKPENIMIRKDDGLVKVLDFGLAKVSAPRRAATGSVDYEAGTLMRANTSPGVVMGTLAYMSPEQARSDAVDERTDIWSLGVVLYEMVAGCSPFVGGTSNEIISAILSKEPPPPLTRFTRRVPERLEEIIDKALAKNRDERYQTSKDLLIDLKRLKQSLELKAGMERNASTEAPRVPPLGESDKLEYVEQPSTSAGGATQTIASMSSAEYIAKQVKSHKRGVMISIAILFLAIATGVLVYLWRVRQTVTATQPEIKSLAVLPLQNLSGNPAEVYFADGMTEALINDLAQIRALKVISRTCVMRYKGGNKSVPEIARELNVDGVIEGSVQRSGGRVKVTAQLIYAGTETLLWSHAYERETADVLKLQSEVARAVADEIRVQVTPEERVRLASARSVNPQAHEAYLLGRFHLGKRNEEDLEQAIEYFERAIGLAPDDAAAYAGLASAWLERGIWGAKEFKEVEAPARRAALKAIELNTNNAEAIVALAAIKQTYDWDWAGAEADYQRALAVDPNSVDAHFYYAVMLMALGRHAEAIMEIERANQVEPLSSNIQSTFGRILYRARKYEEAVQHLKLAIEFDPRNFGAYSRLGDVYTQMGRYDEALAMYQKIRILRPEREGFQAGIALVQALTGKHDEARRTLGHLKSRAFGIAAVYGALGDRDAAFKVLEQAVAERSALLIFIKEDPSLASLHADPRWPRLLRRMNFPPE